MSEKTYDDLSADEKELVDYLKHEFTGRFDLQKKDHKIYEGLRVHYPYILDCAWPKINPRALAKIELIKLASSGATRPKSNSSDPKERYLGTVLIDLKKDKEFKKIIDNHCDWFKYKTSTGRKNFEQRLVDLKKLKKKPKKGSSLFRFFHQNKNKIYKLLKKTHPYFFSSKMELSHKKMLNLMPKNVSFKKGQRWRGTTSKYIFVHSFFGEFTATPDRLMGKNGIWAKGRSGHPKELGSRDTRPKPVVCSNGKIYESSACAARELNISKAGVCNVLSGKQKSAGGYTFKYVEEE